MSEAQNYNPNGLLDALMDKMKLKNDAALARELEVAPPIISKLRHHRLPVGPSFILKCHERGGMSVKTIREYIGGAA